MPAGLPLSSVLPSPALAPSTPAQTAAAGPTARDADSGGSPRFDDALQRAREQGAPPAEADERPNRRPGTRRDAASGNRPAEPRTAAEPDAAQGVTESSPAGAAADPAMGRLPAWAAARAGGPRGGPEAVRTGRSATPGDPAAAGAADSAAEPAEARQRPGASSRRIDGEDTPGAAPSTLPAEPRLATPGPAEAGDTGTPTVTATGGTPNADAADAAGAGPSRLADPAALPLPAGPQAAAHPRAHDRPTLPGNAQPADDRRAAALGSRDGRDDDGAVGSNAVPGPNGTNGSNALNALNALNTLTGPTPSWATAGPPPAAATAPTLSPAAPSPTPEGLASATLEPPVGSPAFAGALGARISLLARDGIDRAELRVHPADLGPVAVQLQLDGSQLRVEFVAAAADTRQALEQSLPALASSLRDAGFTLSGGGVFQQTPGRGGTPDGRADAAPSAERGGSAPSAGAAPALRREQGLVDLFA
jgi:hypothetical protein